MKKRELYFGVGLNRPIGFKDGMIALPIIGITVTAHPIDRTWSVYIHLVFFSIGFGWVDRSDWDKNESTTIKPDKSRAHS